MDIPNVKAHRARLLYAAGLRTAEAVAGSTEATLMSILAKGESASALCGTTKPSCPLLPKVCQPLPCVICWKGLFFARRTTVERASFLYAVGLDIAQALVGSIETTVMSILAKGEVSLCFVRTTKPSCSNTCQMLTVQVSTRATASPAMRQHRRASTGELPILYSEVPASSSPLELLISKLKLLSSTRCWGPTQGRGHMRAPALTAPRR